MEHSYETKKKEKTKKKLEKKENICYNQIIFSVTC